MEYVLLLALAALLLAQYLRHRALQERVRRLEEKLDGLAGSTGQEKYKMYYIDEELQNELKQMKQEGQIVQAVKHLREQTGLDLVQARQLVDALIRYPRFCQAGSLIHAARWAAFVLFLNECGRVFARRDRIRADLAAFLRGRDIVRIADLGRIRVARV